MKLKSINSDDGFTIVELIVTMSIVTILSSIAIIAFKSTYNNYKIRGAARRLFSDMQFARVNSIKGGKEWVLDFSADGTYEVRPKVMGTGDRSKKVFIPVEFRPVKVCAFGGTALEEQDAEFNPNGTAGSADYKLSLPGVVYRVYVSSTGTGNVRSIKVSDPPC